MENEITLEAVVGALTDAGLKFQDRGRYLVSQCPSHDDKNPSVQIFKDDFFVNCLAGCGRFHITKAFPRLRNHNYSQSQVRRTPIDTSPKYKTFDLTEEWARLPLIPRDHVFKGLPLEVLDELGWRWDEARSSYFIPYFDGTKTKVPFVQWRHLAGERRFTFLAGAKPTLYGKWNIRPGARLFVAEGTSDAAVLERCGVPWVAAPSAASGGILKAFATHARELQIGLVYAGDNDAAGETLRAALDESGTPYRVCQPPAPYKDWGELYESEGDTGVTKRIAPYLAE